MYSYEANTILTNVTITGNYAGTSGGGMHIVDCVPRGYNSIVWGNLPNEYHNSGGGSYYSASLYCLTGSPDPQFVTPLTASPTPRTGGNFRLLGTSPARDAGLNSDYSAVSGPPTDLGGNTRIKNGTIDQGAYEY
jgi:hypothetical protein